MAVQTNQGGERQGRVMATYLPTDLAARVEAQAEREERSSSQVIKRILRDALNESSGTGDHVDLQR